ncbi:hypothetical protein GCM10027040_25600 [Halomonas shantousis]
MILYRLGAFSKCVKDEDSKNPGTCWQARFGVFYGGTGTNYKALSRFAFKKDANWPTGRQGDRQRNPKRVHHGSGTARMPYIEDDGRN